MEREEAERITDAMLAHLDEALEERRAKHPELWMTEKRRKELGVPYIRPRIREEMIQLLMEKSSE